MKQDILVMLLSVTFVVASRQNIKGLLELCNPLLFLNGNGTKSQKGHDAILVVIDRFSKVAHFLPVKETITSSQLADLYVSRIVSLHGIPLEINSDCGSLFTSRFWESFQEAMGTHLSFSTAYHPQSQGQVERVNQVLEDMLLASVISFGKKWEESLPYAEF